MGIAESATCGGDRVGKCGVEVNLRVKQPEVRHRCSKYAMQTWNNGVNVDNLHEHRCYLSQTAGHRVARTVLAHGLYLSRILSIVFPDWFELSLKSVIFISKNLLIEKLRNILFSVLSKMVLMGLYLKMREVKKIPAFTLMELLIVLVIIGVLFWIGSGADSTVEMSGDAKFSDSKPQFRCRRRRQHDYKTVDSMR